MKTTQTVVDAFTEMEEEYRTIEDVRSIFHKHSTTAIIVGIGKPRVDYNNWDIVAEEVSQYFRDKETKKLYKENGLPMSIEEQDNDN